MDDQRTLPTSDLDMQMMMTNAVWGRPEVSEELKSVLEKSFSSSDEHGNVVVTKRSLWGLLGFYTRDLRLANLAEWNGELKRCRYMLDLANDYLVLGYYEPFILALSRAVNVLETSQSKNGFLRKQMNTFTQQSTSQNLDPPKKSFFGKKSNYEQNGGY